MMHRFFIDSNFDDRFQIEFSEEISNQITRVFRMREGDQVIGFNGKGKEAVIQLDQINKNFSNGSVINSYLIDNEPKVKIHLFQSLIKAERFEYALQKCVEVGVTTFTPIISERTEVQPPSTNRIIRWKKIIQESSEQNGRSYLPQLNETQNFRCSIQNILKGSILIPWEKEMKLNLKPLINNGLTSPINIFIGPVGGFSADEIDYAKLNGAISLSLGKRIFRSETAGSVISSILLYESGDFDV
ncbi:MAG: hypothetical protein CL734_01075 [Chloroflexi bacterium]|nr:hypothetical protein [Chloroflexota bacterium]